MHACGRTFPARPDPAAPPRTCRPAKRRGDLRSAIQPPAGWGPGSFNGVGGEAGSGHAGKSGMREAGRGTGGRERGGGREGASPAGRRGRKYGDQKRRVNKGDLGVQGPARVVLHHGDQTPEFCSLCPPISFDAS